MFKINKVAFALVTFLILFSIPAISAIEPTKDAVKGSDPVVSSLSCNIADCKRRKVLSQCPGCNVGIPYCLDGGFCVTCSGFCIPFFTDPELDETMIQMAEARGADPRSVVPPEYAVISTEPMPENCIVEDGSESKMVDFTAAIWNPTEFLDQIEPFGVSISLDLLEEISLNDPHAAWVIGQRMRRGDGLLPSVDMHQGQIERNNRILKILGIHESGGDSTKMDAEYEALNEGEIFHLRYRTNFEKGAPPSITVESFIVKDGSMSLIDHTTTKIVLSKKPVKEMMVVASDNYMAPVYEVKGFKTDNS